MSEGKNVRIVFREIRESLQLSFGLWTCLRGAVLLLFLLIREIENIGRGSTFGDFVTIRTLEDG